MAEDANQDFDMADLGAAIPALDPRRQTVYSDDDNLTYSAPQSFSLPMRPQNANDIQAKGAPLPQTPPYDHPAPQSISPSDSEKVFYSLYDPNDPDALYDFYDYSEDTPVPGLNYDDGPTDMDPLMRYVETDTGIFDPNIPLSPMQSETSNSAWTISGYPPSPTPSEAQASLEAGGWPLVHLQIIDEFMHPATGVKTYAMRALDEHYDSVGWDPVYAFWLPADMAPTEAIEAWEARGRLPVTIFTADDCVVVDRDDDHDMDEPERSEWDDGFEVAGAEIEEGDFVPGEYEGKYVPPEEEEDCIE